MTKKPERYLSWEDLKGLGILGVLSKMQIRRMWEKDPPEFPRPVHLTERRLAFLERQIIAWQEARSYSPTPSWNSDIKQCSRAEQDAA